MLTGALYIRMCVVVVVESQIASFFQDMEKKGGLITLAPAQRGVS